MGEVRAAAALTLTLLLAACGERGEPVQRVELPEGGTVLPVVLPQSPDTSEAVWLVAVGVDHDHIVRGASVMVLNYGNRDESPLLTLACNPVAPATLTIIRHAPALPGQTALFPVIGNGMRSRFPVDAAKLDGTWHWQATLPVEDSRWDVFTGSRQLLATLPGGGMLDIAGSRMPGAFIAWCREEIETLPREEDLPPPDETRPPPSRREQARRAAAEADGG